MAEGKNSDIIYEFFSSGERSEIIAELKRDLILCFDPKFDPSLIKSNININVNNTEYFIGNNASISKVSSIFKIKADIIKERVHIFKKTILVRNQPCCLFINKYKPNIILYADDCNSVDNILKHYDVTFPCLSVSVKGDNTLYINHIATKNSSHSYCNFKNTNEVMKIISEICIQFKCDKIELFDAATLENISIMIKIRILRLLKNAENISIYEKYGFKCKKIDDILKYINIIRSIKLTDIISEITAASDIYNTNNTEIKDSEVIIYNFENDTETIEESSNALLSWQGKFIKEIYALRSAFLNKGFVNFVDINDIDLSELAFKIMSFNSESFIMFKINGKHLLEKTLKFCYALNKIDTLYVDFSADAGEFKRLIDMLP